MTPPNSPQGADVEKLRDQLADALGNDYTLGAILGAGQCGVVFLARNVTANRDVAIKVSWDHPAARAQLARETSLTSAIVHPHVLAMRKLYLAKPVFVIEMPIAPGGTLDDRFEKGGAVSFQYVRAILRQVAGAFDEAHAMGIVHGALCPAKILLDENGQCLVSDFGLRLPVLSGAAALHPSELGIPAYMPTEQRYDRSDIDGRIDQYALGVIAFELLRGRRTWHVSREGVVAVEALEVAPNRPIAPGVPLSASVAIKRATAREPGHRYPSVAEFVRAFSGDTPDAGPAVRPERRSRLKLPGRAWLLAPIAVALAIVASRPSVRTALRGLVPADWSLRDADQPDEDEGQTAADTSPLTTANTGRKSGGDVVPRRAKPRPPRSAVNGPAQALTPGVITVTLTGGSSAFVVIDGQTRGGTPLSWKANAGRHVVSLRGEDKYSPVQLSVNLAGGDTARANFIVTSRR